MSNQPTCAERVQSHLDSHLETFAKYQQYGWDDHGVDVEDMDPAAWKFFEEQGFLVDFMLSFDYVEPGTFDDQPAG